MKIDVCGINIDKCTLNEAVEAIAQHAVSGTVPKYVVTPNAHHVVMLQEDAHFREIYQNAFLVVPDGVPLVWAADFLQTPLIERVNGTDLFEQLCELASKIGLKIFLLGGRPGAADGAKQILNARYPGLNIVDTYCPPYGFETDIAELELINTRITSAAPHIIFVGLGAPKQEYWIYANYQKIGVPISVGIGVSFELVSGMVQRAPIWMQKKGLEWFFRLLVEPSRLWKRYLLGNTLFLWLVLKQRLGLFRFE